MDEKQIRELLSKLLYAYAFSQALSSVKLEKLSDMKIQKQDIRGEMVNLHYRLVEKSSLETSRQHSVKCFRVYYNDIKDEHKNRVRQEQ